MRLGWTGWAEAFTGISVTALEVQPQQTAPRSSSHAPCRTLERTGAGHKREEGAVCFQPGHHLSRWQRAAEKISLREVAAFQSQIGQLPRGFHSLRNHHHAHVVANFNRLLNHDPIAVVQIHIHHEQLVDLQFCRRNVLQLLHHGVARSKIVDRKLNALHPQPGQHVEHAR